MPARALALSLRDATARNIDSAIADIKASADSDIIGVVADAASAEGAAIIAKAERSVDILVNNLGIMRADRGRVFRHCPLGIDPAETAFSPSLCLRPKGAVTGQTHRHQKLIETSTPRPGLCRHSFW
ncbi:hypothetical protein [Rhizobium bangladeshense]|uniref:hypothetical protein n=1 Tax=Rhizobium bangladeshense TaxID=1138189 RepID=UPI002180A513|nr:hypothetical protein [Rhizobium bangladeshense]